MGKIVTVCKTDKTCVYELFSTRDGRLSSRHCGLPAVANYGRAPLCMEHLEFVAGNDNKAVYKDGENRTVSAARFLAQLETAGV